MYFFIHKSKGQMCRLRMDEFSIIIITVTTYQSQISAECLNEIHSMQYGMA